MGKEEKMKEERRRAEQAQQDKKKRENAMIRTVVILVVVVGAIIIGAYIMQNRKSDDDLATGDNSEDSAQEDRDKDDTLPEQEPLKDIEVDEELIANKKAIISTPGGDIVLEFFTEAAPKTVMNFIELAQSGFYNDTTFHRVEPSFVIQGGDPLSKDDNPGNDGTGGPDYRFVNEINPEPLGLSPQQVQLLQVQGFTFTQGLPSEKNAVGTLSMANSGPKSNGSQFFVITDKDQAHLDGKHTVFAKVVEGLDVARKVKPGDAMQVRIEEL